MTFDSQISAFSKSTSIKLSRHFVRVQSNVRGLSLKTFRISINFDGHGKEERRAGAKVQKEVGVRVRVRDQKTNYGRHQIDVDSGAPWGELGKKLHFISEKTFLNLKLPPKSVPGNSRNHLTAPCHSSRFGSPVRKGFTPLKVLANA